MGPWHAKGRYRYHSDASIPSLAWFPQLVGSLKLTSWGSREFHRDFKYVSRSRQWLCDSLHSEWLASCGKVQQPVLQQPEVSVLADDSQLSIGAHSLLWHANTTSQWFCRIQLHSKRVSKVHYNIIPKNLLLDWTQNILLFALWLVHFPLIRRK